MLLLTWCVSRIGKQDSSRWLATLPIRQGYFSSRFLLNRREMRYFAPVAPPVWNSSGQQNTD